MTYKQLFMNVSVVMFVLGASPVLAAVTPTSVIMKTTPTDLSTTNKATAGAMMGTEAKKSDYVLPYPGILPDHPLYFLKKLRDQIIEMLVTDPTRKSEFYLLQSDKWIAASVLLEQKGAKDMAQATMDASSQKMVDAVTQLSNLKQNGREVQAGSIDRIVHAIDKHLEVLDSLSAKNTVDTSASRNSLIKAQGDVSKLKS